MSNYPPGMTHLDLIHVGHLEDPEDYRPCANCGVIREEHGMTCSLDDLRNVGIEERFTGDESLLALLEYEPGEFEEEDWERKRRLEGVDRGAV